jgi:lipopolysaccharide/colanic/teichoic acid biosynthesis glycosyltransferase
VLFCRFTGRKLLNARTKPIRRNERNDRPAQKAAAQPPEDLRPPVKRWQKIALALSALALAAWLLALVAMAWK